MSGHSKWSTIKHKKAATDAKRGQLFTKLARDITMAAKQGDPDPAMNPNLRLAIQKAKSSNMPNDNIDRAIKRATGSGDADTLDEVVYEGYGPGGIAVLVEAITDNRNRTVSEVRLGFSRSGGSLAEAGAVAWQFDRRGVVTVSAGNGDPDEIQLAAIEAGALDVEVSDDGSVEIVTEPADLHTVRDAMEALGVEIENAEIAQVPKNRVELDEAQAIQALRLFERLDDLDDVSRVYSNLEFNAAVLEAAEA